MLRPLLLASLVLAAAPTWAAEAPLAPFHADYVVLRNGKELGKATLDLRNTGGTWQFDSSTHGTAGMAAMLGVDVQEKSTFTWNANQPACGTYDYSQKTLKSKTLNIHCDWTAKSASIDDNGKPGNVALAGPAMDRHLVALALMADLKAGATSFAYPVVDRAQVSTQQYVQAGHEAVQTGAGTIDAVKMVRDRGADAKRSTTYWFAPQKNWLPVQIEQIEKSDTITMRLASAK